MSFLGKLAITDGAVFGIGVSMLFAAGMAEAQRRRDYRMELRSSETPTRGERHFEVVKLLFGSFEEVFEFRVLESVREDLGVECDGDLLDRHHHSVTSQKSTLLEPNPFTTISNFIL